MLLKGKCCIYTCYVLNHSFSVAWKRASLLPHVKYELPVILFPNANAQLWSLDIPELTHSATQQIHRDEAEEGQCKIALSGIKRTPKPQSITIPLQYFFHWKVWVLMTPNWFFFFGFALFQHKIYVTPAQPASLLSDVTNKSSQTLRFIRGVGGKHSFLKPHQVC